MRDQLAKLLADARSGDRKRPVLRGQPQAGNAWDDYDAGIRSIKRLPSMYPAAAYIRGDPKTDRTKAEEAVRLHAPMLEAMQRGVSRSEVDRRIDWESGPAGIFSLYPVANLGVCKARFLDEAGDLRSARELLLDTAQFGLDVASAGNLMDAHIGISIFLVATEELYGLLRSDQLDRQALLDVARELEVLDQRFPRIGDIHVNAAMANGFRYLKAGSLKALCQEIEYKGPGMSTWRYGFSGRLLMIDAFEQELSAMRRLKAARELPWKEAWPLEARVYRELECSNNAIVRLCYDGSTPQKPRDSFREARARLRLLRQAASLRSGAQVADLNDPFGEKLKSAPTERGMKFWSVGSDGNDDGGVGEWKYVDGKDIVLAVDR